MECLSYIGMYVSILSAGVHVSRHLKEELAWAIDKWLLGISHTMLFKTVILLMN